MYDWELSDDALKAWVRLRQASDALWRGWWKLAWLSMTPHSPRLMFWGF